MGLWPSISQLVSAVLGQRGSGEAGPMVSLLSGHELSVPPPPPPAAADPTGGHGAQQPAQLSASGPSAAPGTGVLSSPPAPIAPRDGRGTGNRQGWMSWGDGDSEAAAGGRSSSHLFTCQRKRCWHSDRNTPLGLRCLKPARKSRDALCSCVRQQSSCFEETSLAVREEMWLE